VWAFDREGAFLPAKVGLLGLDVLGLFVWWVGFVERIRTYRYGPSRLVWDHIPLRLGEEIRIGFHPSPQVREKSVTFKLRCYETTIETLPNSLGKPERYRVMHQVYEDAQTVEPTPTPEGERARFEVTFKLPDGDYGTGKTGEPKRTRFWQLEVRGERDYFHQFNLPIYDRADQNEISGTGGSAT